MTPTDIALTIGASTRLTRAITHDLIGQWAIRDPVHRWARWDGTTEPRGWRQKLAAGVDCSWCVSMWTTTALVAAHTATTTPTTRHLWRLGCLTLALAHATAHATRLGDDQ